LLVGHFECRVACARRLIRRVEKAPEKKGPFRERLRIQELKSQMEVPEFLPGWKRRAGGVNLAGSLPPVGAR